ncbi:MAG: hypothetical protein QOI57_1511, partial [Rubrobacteraceae bacterium]|nr:hypothetical protein [Rubrobacteraceae bacterium]
MRGHDKTGRTEPALYRTCLDEGVLHGMQPVPLGEPFDRQDLTSVSLSGQNQARTDQNAVQV